jgi:hypothetical protein
MTVNRGDLIHAVRVGQAIGSRDHRASATCWCEPSPLLRDLASGATVWVHGATGEGDNRAQPDAEQDGLFQTVGERHTAAVDAVARRLGMDR